jgi:pimeloyl-ACP methyl ester carboxylesterase
VSELNVQLVLIPRAGHGFFVDQPAAFVRDAERFLRASRARER